MTFIHGVFFTLSIIYLAYLTKECYTGSKLEKIVKELKK